MKLIYAHFPINAKVEDAGKTIEFNNFLGGKHQHRIRAQPGVTMKLDETEKDAILFQGVDNAAVSLTCAQCRQCCKVGKKDERKFLDGIYVIDKTTLHPREE